MGCDRARIEARGHGHRVRHRHARRRVGAGVPRPAARPDTGRALQDRAQRGHGIPSGHRPVGRGISIGLHALHAPQDRALCRGRARRFHQRAHAGPRPRHRRPTGRRRRNRRRAVAAQPSRERAAGRAHRAPALEPVADIDGLRAENARLRADAEAWEEIATDQERSYSDATAKVDELTRTVQRLEGEKRALERKAVPRGWPNASSRSRAT